MSLDQAGIRGKTQKTPFRAYLATWYSWGRHLPGPSLVQGQDLARLVAPTVLPGGLRGSKRPEAGYPSRAHARRATQSWVTTRRKLSRPRTLLSRTSCKYLLPHPQCARHNVRPTRYPSQPGALRSAATQHSHPAAASTQGDRQSDPAVALRCGAHRRGWLPESARGVGVAT